MEKRTELHEKLVELLGSRNVYFQPPENLKIKYPAIVYNYSRLGKLQASNDIYLFRTSYDLTLIDSDPDSEFAKRLLLLPYCSFDRTFRSDNLNHFTFTIYY